MTLKASFLVGVFSMGTLAPVIAQNKQNKKPRKKLTELLLKADSLRLQLRQSADRGRMLQWGDSLLMAELGKSTRSYGHNYPLYWATFTLTCFDFS